MPGVNLLAHNLAVRSLRVLLTLMVSALLAFWLTDLTAPRRVAALAFRAAPEQTVNKESVLKVFGMASGPTAQINGIELTGLYARADGQGFATFRTPGGLVSGIAGMAVRPGVQLRQIGADHVILTENGTEHRLALPAASAAAPAFITPAAPAGAASVTGTAAAVENPIPANPVKPPNRGSHRGTDPSDEP